LIIKSPSCKKRGFFVDFLKYVTLQLLGGSPKWGRGVLPLEFPKKAFIELMIVAWSGTINFQLNEI